MKILYAASEASPFIKVGGLGDVAGSLPKALCKQGEDARVIIPLYSAIKWELREKLTYITNFEITLGWRKSYCGLFSTKVDGVIYYFIDNERYFKRSGVYGEYDDAERFAFFSKAVLDCLPHIGFYPDVINANDWHTALVPVYLNLQYRDNPCYKNIRTVFSIHNIEFQGKYGIEILEKVFGISSYHTNLLYYGECINLMKAAIECCDKVVTVSKTYAKEILNPYFAFGLDSILRSREYKIVGIVNGIDTDVFDPATDKYLYKNYTFKTRNLKYFNKKGLQEEMALPVRSNVPLFGMVTRLTSQKGLDLFRPIMHELLAKDIQFIVLGSGDYVYEEFMRHFEYKYHDKMRAYIGFNPAMASKIYASCDMFLMPSKSEPCGLAQMIALRYGTIPIVNAVGGLRDTVIPFDATQKTGNGLTFQSYNSFDMLDSINRALDIYYNKENYSCIKKNAMSGDYSWDAAVLEYLKVYRNL